MKLLSILGLTATVFAIVDVILCCMFVIGG